MNRETARRWAAEVGGTALLVGIGTGTIVAAGRVGGIPQWWMGCAWFAAVLIPLVLFIARSGAHLNPAVTFALALSGRFAWRNVPGYWAAQFAGAFVASAAVLTALGPSSHLGATIPVQGGLLLDFAVEAIFTALLVASVFLLADRGEGRRRWRMLLPPLVVGVSTYVIGPWTGSSLNPARTVAPAVLSGTFTDLWLYLVSAPLAAAVVAALWRPQSVDIADRGPGRIQAGT